MSNIVKTKIAYCKEPLRSPFGFKGSSLDELWQVFTQIEDENGNKGFGLGVLSVLWSDSLVFSTLGQERGNRAMYDTTCHALALLEGKPFTNPLTTMEQILPDILSYAAKATKQPKVRMTFALNALVSIDLALWQLYANINGYGNFNQLISGFTDVLTQRQAELGSIPLITYGTTDKEIVSLVENGCFILKLKLGSDPDKSNNLEKMLKWDCNRLLQLHQIVKHFETPYTDCGHPVYYLDMNGRYDCLERLEQLLDFASTNHILERIAVLEEPFPENSGISVKSLPITIAADESAHCPEDIRKLAKAGYQALALKPIAKTLSMTLNMLKEANRQSLVCFCADLTVNPLLVEWNKNVACRLPALPGLKIGVIESNGAQNYKNWNEMKNLFSYPHASWFTPQAQRFILDDDYYKKSGGILEEPSSYIRQIEEGNHWKTK